MILSRDAQAGMEEEKHENTEKKKRSIREKKKIKREHREGVLSQADFFLTGTFSSVLG